MSVSELHTGVLADHPGCSDTAVVCAVCLHPWPEHDPIGVRYCTATTASSRAFDTVTSRVSAW
ncbi:hypothetical protein SAMN05216188_12154 [Lentzea xinjiangensis]|uniref:Uncharacterized protein n=1 Tax=Lentzea xinjiangensis TaxID=402600 RepID=A0A1H9UEA8_9PSEU|nr:hypothetical protein SAMN05216188_12154 [Lentzea xinjiangensis]